MEFLSTPSARRATQQSTYCFPLYLNFYPRPPRGGRPGLNVDPGNASEFLSTPSARRATVGGVALLLRVEISIHALREEGDRSSRAGRTLRPIFLSTPSARRATHVAPGLDFSNTYFYPRPPRGGRRGVFEVTNGDFQFLSTPSARRATRASTSAKTRKPISIHALREEGDPVLDVEIKKHRISIHALREEGDVVRDGPMFFCC